MTNATERLLLILKAVAVDRIVDQSQAELAALTGLGERTIRGALAILTDRGDLEIVTQGGGRGMSTVYRICELSTTRNPARNPAENPADLSDSSESDPVDASLSPYGRERERCTGSKPGTDWPESRITQPHRYTAKRYDPIPQRGDHKQCLNPNCGAPAVMDGVKQCPWCGVPYPANSIRDWEAEVAARREALAGMNADDELARRRGQDAMAQAIADLRTKLGPRRRH